MQINLKTGLTRTRLSSSEKEDAEPPVVHGYYEALIYDDDARDVISRVQQLDVTAILDVDVGGAGAAGCLRGGARGEFLLRRGDQRRVLPGRALVRPGVCARRRGASGTCIWGRGGDDGVGGRVGDEAVGEGEGAVRGDDVQDVMLPSFPHLLVLV
nr:hypothetical protein CFP56_58742 [Quercus suber]